MNKYHKINTLFKRDNNLKIIETEWCKPEYVYLCNLEWDFYEKVDGTNIRAIYSNSKLQIKGKNDTDTPHIPLGVSYYITDKFVNCNIDISKEIQPEFCIYGEGYNPRKQKWNGMISGFQSFIVFDINIDGWWLNRKDVVDIATKLNLKVVPYLGCGTLYDAIRIVKNGLPSQLGNYEAEGIVAHPKIPLYARDGSRIIVKIKGKDFK